MLSFRIAWFPSYPFLTLNDQNTEKDPYNICNIFLNPEGSDRCPMEDASRIIGGAPAAKIAGKLFQGYPGQVRLPEAFVAHQQDDGIKRRHYVFVVVGLEITVPVLFQDPFLQEVFGVDHDVVALQIIPLWHQVDETQWGAIGFQEFQDQVTGTGEDFFNERRIHLEQSV